MRMRRWEWNGCTKHVVTYRNPGLTNCTRNEPRTRGKPALGWNEWQAPNSDYFMRRYLLRKSRERIFCSSTSHDGSVSRKKKRKRANGFWARHLRSCNTSMAAAMLVSRLFARRIHSTKPQFAPFLFPSITIHIPTLIPPHISQHPLNTAHQQSPPVSQWKRRITYLAL